MPDARPQHRAARGGGTARAEQGGGGRADPTAQRSIARLRASRKKFRDGLSYGAASSVYSAP
ncbi:hypothetical protein WK10_00565 [Burkholderia ubonensis]|nr:hypothetical protein WK10_00565 [Burkholderia ubonensis]KVT67175.1 hypothetical protein WK55_28695 [Burkholderia ubonensis]KVZ37621.1 hypothetical protein WL17_18815 [Burkholderia ubonensis]KVZ55382.1 hypothetical protein WL18_23930 [Burkholderia ubonensis]KWF07281.1 hypothetical protein WL83_24775 [Burkholderia ubonensis]